MDIATLQNLTERLTRFRRDLLDHINDQDLNDDGGCFDNGTEGYEAMVDLGDLESEFRQFLEKSSAEQERLYVLRVIDDVDPVLIGPFTNKSERDRDAREVRRDTDGEDGVFALDIKYGEPSVYPYSGDFCADDEAEEGVES